MRDREPEAPRAVRAAGVSVATAIAFGIGGRVGPVAGTSALLFAVGVFLAYLVIDGAAYGYAMARYWSAKQRETEARLAADRRAKG